jgi:hypothetical protein
MKTVTITVLSDDSIMIAVSEDGKQIEFRAAPSIQDETTYLWLKETHSDCKLLRVEKWNPFIE